MKKLFGTDGIRNKAHEGFLTQENLRRFGNILGYWLKNKNRSKALSVIIARDTRESGKWIEDNIISGLSSWGIKVLRAEVFPTPGLAFLIKKLGADLGIVISASHNPWHDNGIKLLSRSGYKLKDAEEKEIENLIFNEKTDAILEKENPKAATIEEAADGKRLYIDHLKSIVENLSLKGKKIVLDCANGANSEIAPKVYRELGADVVAIYNKPSGKNINENCGSLHPKVVAEEAKKQNADFGFTFDGDGDRVIMTDRYANIYDGDFMMAIVAKDFVKKNKLPENTIVGTQMTNIGLDIALHSMGCKIIKTDVGDRYVLDKMLENGYKFGGEQSGHIIFMDYSTTGDGLITSLIMSKIITESGKEIKDLASVMKKMPQILLNIKVKEKVPLESIKEVKARIEKYSKELGEKGRIFVRYSGTEPLARVMIEGPDKESIESMANSIADAIKEAVGKA